MQFHFIWFTFWRFSIVSHSRVFLANVYGHDFLRPPPLSQHSVKCRHHWACPMCLYGTLCWSGGWWGCWWSRTSCALLTACLPGTSSLGTSCLRREITRSYRFRLLALYFSDAFTMQDSSMFISMFRVWQRISESAAVMSDLYSSTVGDFRIFCCLV